MGLVRLHSGHSECSNASASFSEQNLGEKDSGSSWYFHISFSHGKKDFSALLLL